MKLEKRNLEILLRCSCHRYLDIGLRKVTKGSLGARPKDLSAPMGIEREKRVEISDGCRSARTAKQDPRKKDSREATTDEVKLDSDAVQAVTEHKGKI